jgi:hypothetical protein
MTTLDTLQAFANKHKVVLEDKGECGFGRPCVGFTYGGNYIDYNPMSMGSDYKQIWPYDSRLSTPAGVDAYHKHDCVAVLVTDDNYEAALDQLLKWVEHLESHGVLEVVQYETGADGIQALVSGVFGRAIRFKDSAQQAA